MLNLFIISFQLIAIIGFVMLILRLQLLLDSNFKVPLRIGLCGLSLMLAGLCTHFLVPTKLGGGSSLSMTLLNGLGLLIFLYACWQFLLKTPLDQLERPHLTTPFFREDEMSRHLRTAMNLIDQGFAVWDKEDNLIASNKKFQELMELPEALLQPGVSLSALISHRADNGNYGDGDPDQQVNERIRQIKKNRKSGYSLATTLSGDSVFIRHYAIPEYGDITTLSDITRLRKKENQLATQDLLLQTALDNMTNGLAIYDDQHKLITVNQRFKDLFEFPDKLVKAGTKLEELLHFRGNRGDFGNVSIDQIISEKVQILTDRKVHRTEEKTTEEHWVEIFRSPTANKGSIVIINDITERRQTEIELERLSIEKDKFFAIIAHDLRGPLASLFGVIKLLAKQSDSLPKIEVSILHESLYETGKNLVELLENLFEWAELRRNTAPFNPYALDLGPILATNLTLFRSFALEKNVHLGVVNTPNELILSDSNMIDTVLRNLIQNAIKFSYPGGKVIISSQTEHEWMWIQIADKGIGISKKRIKSIFKLDRTFSTVGTNGEVGSGLGLHVCNELIKKCGGKLDIISQEGNGTKVKFSIPLA